MQEHLNKLEAEGLVVIPSVLSSLEINSLRKELQNAINEDEINLPNVFDLGMVHNCVARGRDMARLLDHKIMNKYIGACFSETAILYAYQSSSLKPGSGNYGSRIHVDCPRFVPGYYTNMGIMWPLDDFTTSNGATYYLPGSHKNESLPNSEYFYKNAKRATAKAGDMVILNARLVHAAGVNKTNKVRHALTMNFCRSFMRQRFDLPRLLSDETINSLGTDGKRLIGMNVRMPTKLSEFYLPVEERLYKPNQG